MQESVDCEGWYFGKEVMPKPHGASDTELSEQSHYFSKHLINCCIITTYGTLVIMCDGAQVKYTLVMYYFHFMTTSQ
jgi:hypothetical protein